MARPRRKRGPTNPPPTLWARFQKAIFMPRSPTENQWTMVRPLGGQPIPWNHPFISWIYGNDERMTDVSPREDAVLDFEAIHYPFWSRNDVLEKLAGEFWLYIILDILWAIQSFVTIYTPVYGFKWFLQWTL